MNGIFYNDSMIVTVKEDENCKGYYELESYRVDDSITPESISLDSIGVYTSYNQLDNYECYTEVSAGDVIDVVNDLLY